MRVVVVTDLFEAFALLEQHRQHLRETAPRRGGVVVLDSVTALLSPSLGSRRADAGREHERARERERETQAQGLSLLQQLAAALRRLADEHRCGVLVTNHISGGGFADRERRPALGRAWRSVPDRRIDLEDL